MYRSIKRRENLFPFEKAFSWNVPRTRSEVGAKNPNSSRFFFFFFFLLLRRTGIEARTREGRAEGRRRQEKRQDTRFPSRWVMLGASRFVQEPVDVPTRRQTRIDPPIADTRETAKPSSKSFSSRGGEEIRREKRRERERKNGKSIFSSRNSDVRIFFSFRNRDWKRFFVY